MLMDMYHSLTDAFVFDEHVPVLNDQNLNWPDLCNSKGFWVHMIERVEYNGYASVYMHFDSNFGQVMNIK